jgi:hypothetical protein
MTTIWKYSGLISSIALSGYLLLSCTQSDYTKLVKSELAKGIKQDSILLGINFGNTRNEFYGRCFDLNRQKLVSQGPGNTSVQYFFTDSLVHDQPTSMRLLFYPGFNESDSLINMDMEFSYPGWAPWNEQFQADSLKIKVLELLMLWYKGNEFVQAKVGDSQIPVKVDANRRILVYTKDTQRVLVKIQDILSPEFMHSISKE